MSHRSEVLARATRRASISTAALAVLVGALLAGAAQAANMRNEQLLQMLIEAVPADRRYEKPAA